VYARDGPFVGQANTSLASDRQNGRDLKLGRMQHSELEPGRSPPIKSGESLHHADVLMLSLGLGAFPITAQIRFIPFDTHHIPAVLSVIQANVHTVFPATIVLESAFLLSFLWAVDCFIEDEGNPDKASAVGAVVDEPELFVRPKGAPSLRRDMDDLHCQTAVLHEVAENVGHLRVCDAPLDDDPVLARDGQLARRLIADLARREVGAVLHEPAHAARCLPKLRVEELPIPITLNWTSST
jgi:hypothetical protein